jgi:hypothetical protein
MTLDEAIKALGQTEESVTDKLREMGIKGYRQMASSCPIAKYLNACGFPYVTVCTYACTYATDNKEADNEERYYLPKHVRDWASDFDVGKYPEFYLE